MLATMVLYDSELRDQVYLLMELAGLKNYTQFVGLHGSSEHGKKEDTVAWPGSNEILFVMMNEDQYLKFKDQVVKMKTEQKPAPGLFLMAWPLKEFV